MNGLLELELASYWSKLHMPSSLICKPSSLWYILGIAKLLTVAFDALVIGRSRRHFGSIIGPEAERVATGVAVWCCGESVTAGTEDQVDRIVCGQEFLCLPVELEPAE